MIYMSTGQSRGCRFSVSRGIKNMLAFLRWMRPAQLWRPIDVDSVLN